MAILTKTQLSASNATSFPDNVSGFITPALLRNFNTSSIDSYASLSGSNTFVGNQVITGSVIATSFTGSLQGTASWANNALTASFANSSNTGSLLKTASVSNDIIDFTKGDNTTFSITVNNVKNSSTSSVISVGGDNTNASRKIVFVGTTVASVNEQLLIAANAPDLTYNPTTNVINATASYASYASYASASTSASYALVAQSANTIGSTTVSGIQTYTYSQTLNTGGSLTLKETKKFVTGSFGCISGSWTKFMNISHSTNNWRGSGVFTGTNMGINEFGMTQTNFVLRANNPSDISATSIKSGTNTITCPDISASWNGSSIDIFSRSIYNATGSLLVDMTINLSVTGSTLTFF